ncbi:MAG: hypothetical protein NC937_03175 [Candidatus Omnitrophica bacterium]|nr:hypothetical protein [Candidatus Omnitrophota bacterium]
MEISFGGKTLSGYYCVNCIKRDPELKLIFKMLSENKKTEKKRKFCPFCGTTSLDLKKSGFAGCAMCYSIFRSYIRKKIREIHTGFFHKGKVPIESKNEKVFMDRFEDRMRNAVVRFDFKKIKQIKREWDRFIKNG